MRRSPDHVNRKYNSVKRKLKIPFLFHYCDDENTRIIAFPADSEPPRRG
jgi:hypothetical protein